MKMLKSLTTTGLALCALLIQIAPAAAQTNVAGEWTVTIDGPQGPAQGVVTIAQEGSTLTGTFNLPEVGEVELSDGMVDGNTVTFDVDIDVQGTPILLEVEGEVSGNSIEGNMYVAEFGLIPFRGERAP